MIKPYFTRKNFIKLSIAIFYSFVILFTGICLDANYALVSRKNPISTLGKLFKFTEIRVGASMYLCVILVAIYVAVFVGLFLYERQYAIVNNKKKYSIKMLATYFLTFVVCLALSLGIGILIQRPLTNEKITLVLKYVGQTMMLATMIYVCLFVLIGSILMFVVNFLLIDKPFKSLDKKEEVDLGLEEAEVDITKSFDSTPANDVVNVQAAASASSSTGNIESSIRKAEELDDREKVFPALSNIDVKYNGYNVEKCPTDDVDLETLCVGFRNYLAKVEHLYYELDVIRYFISGLSSSKFMILEGLSGTGKSSLPRYFAKYISSEVLFVSVQATWRDKTNLIGFFNDFSKIYQETEFFAHLYEANYNPDKIHLFVLDEMNISRVEYYFADFLSVLEFPEDARKLKVLQLPYGFIPPARLDEGDIVIPSNCYFVGTANKDDSTFTITDKVYDRAITIDFDNRNEKFEVSEDAEPIKLSYSHLKGLFNAALDNKANQLTDEDFRKLYKVTDFIYNNFDLTFGNRILNQITKIVPVFISCGGKKEDALDFLLSRKVISKLEGRFEEYVKNALKQLLALIEETYGVNVLKRSEKTIQAILRRL